MKDIIFICRKDHANLIYHLVNSLRYHNLLVDGFKIDGSCSFYKNSIPKIDRIKFKELTNEYKIVTFGHSEYYEPEKRKHKNKFFVLHGGSKYRQNPKKINKIFNRMVEKTIIQTGDLLDLGAKNQEWILPAINIDEIRPSFGGIEKYIRISHFPSNPKIKGSETINLVLKKVTENNKRVIYNNSSKTLNFEDNLKRISLCDIYIEAVAPTETLLSNGAKYGEWGLTALEASALGKIVITHFLSKERYEKEYGTCPLLVANNKEELEKNIDFILSLSNKEILDLKKLHREWVEKLHSYKSIGKRMIDKVYGEFL